MYHEEVSGIWGGHDDDADADCDDAEIAGCEEEDLVEYRAVLAQYDPRVELGEYRT